MLWRARTPGEHRRAAQPGQGIGSSRNGPPGGAKLRSGRAGRSPASPESSGSGCRDPSSRLLRPGSASRRARGQRAGANGESGHDDPGGSAPGDDRTTNPQGSNGPRERDRLLGEGKLWRGAPRTRAVWNKTAKRRVATAKAASLLKPSRGARSLRTAPVRVWRSSPRENDRKGVHAEKGTRRSAS